MPDNRGIFSLHQYYNKDIIGDIPLRNRETFREFGYFGGGGAGVKTTVDRIDYSNDTATAFVRGPLSVARQVLAATGNSNFGYFGGGYVSDSRVERINYFNDSALATVRTFLSLGRSNLSATGNSNFGYFGGGGNTLASASAGLTVIDRIDYSNDTTTASRRGPLSLARAGLAATGNSNFGYFGGGSVSQPSPGIFSRIERINYSNDSAITIIRGPLSLGRSNLSATGNSNFGYFVGGTGSVGASTRVDRIDYSNDTATASLRGSLSSGSVADLLTATGNSNFGYFAGGGVPSGTTTINRIDYSNDTQFGSTRGPLSSARWGQAGSSSSSFGGSPNSQYGVFPKPFGYFGGGFSGNVSTIDRIDYNNDTTNAGIRGSLSLGRIALAAVGTNNFGYFAGGSAAPSYYSIIDRVDYINDITTALSRNNLSIGKNYLAAVGTNNFGYFAGGSTPTLVSTIERINYSSDTTSTSIRGSLSSARNTLTATGNLNFGYFGGGNSPSTSIIDRINYSNDSLLLTQINSLTAATRYLAATGNNNFGYFGGGFPSLSTINRIDYSSDTTTPLVRGPLSLARYGLSANGNSNFAYFGGGNGPLSIVDRINYSNDTATASVRGSLSSARAYLSATSPLTPSSAFSSSQLVTGTSNTDFQPTSTFFDIQSMRRIEDTTNASVKKRVLGSFGYFGGGFSGTNIFSTIDRINYSNDTTTASVRGALTSTRLGLTSHGNPNFGYYCGGRQSYNPNVDLSAIERIDYSNDLSTPTIRSSLSANGVFSQSISSPNFGYVSTRITFIDRLDYSNDTISPRILSFNLVTGDAKTGNSNFGYFGGQFSPALSTVLRINYSNDKSQLLIRGPLSSERGFLAATGNNNFGYFIAGEVPAIGNISTIDRIDYSNDTATALVRGPISIAKRRFGATGNSNFGYAGGGSGGGSTINRINYSNDLVNAPTRTFMSSSREDLSATTNARNS